MRKLVLVAALAVAAPVGFVSIANADPGVKLAQVGVEIRTDRDRDRYSDEYREHHRGCREVTVRERHGDEVVVRRHERCD
jgi:hypothetical protein